MSQSRYDEIASGGPYLVIRQFMRRVGCDGWDVTNGGKADVTVSSARRSFGQTGAAAVSKGCSRATC